MLRRLLSTNALPATLALQGLGLVLLAFFAQPGDGPVRRDGAAGGGSSTSAEAVAPQTFQIPRDLEPRLLPVPQLPDFDRPLRDEAPAPKVEGPPKSPEPEVEEPALAGLRVQSVAVASLLPVSAAAPLPGAPDSLQPHSIDGRPWLAGTKSAQRGPGPGGGRGPAGTGGGNGGWGGTGIGGSGHGTGGSCPSPGGIGGSRGRPGGTTAGPSGVSGRGGEGGSGPKGTPAGNGGGRPGGGRGKGPAKGKSK